MQAEEKLRQSQKMEAVGQLTGGLAHDFNNLLTGISGSLELMNARLAQGRLTDLDKYIAAAQGAARRAAALTHRLLAFSRRQTLDPQPTDVNALIMGMTDLIQRTVGPAISIETLGASHPWPGHARRRSRAHRDRQPLDRPRGGTQPGPGPGPIPVAERQRHRDRHEPRRGGQGLRPVLHHHYVGDVEREQSLEEQSHDAASRAGQTILIVDDEPTIRMLLTDVLRDQGYAVIEAADSVAGLKVLRSDVHIDLLISDVGLPGGMNGRQMADAGRELRPGLGILFITGYAETAAVGDGQLEAGMQVLTKPFAVEELAARVRAAMGEV